MSMSSGSDHIKSQNAPAHDSTAAELRRRTFKFESTCCRCLCWNAWKAPLYCQQGVRTLMRDLHFAVDHAHLVDGSHIWRQPAMHAQHRAVDKRGERAPIEKLSAILPGVGVAVFALALIVETIDLCDLPRLVVATQQCDAVWVPRFEQQQQRHGLDAIVSAIDEIAHEDVACVRTFTAVSEEFQQVVKLTVDITADSHGTLNWVYRAFFEHEPDAMHRRMGVGVQSRAQQSNSRATAEQLQRRCSTARATGAGSKHVKLLLHILAEVLEIELREKLALSDRSNPRIPTSTRGGVCARERYGHADSGVGTAFEFSVQVAAHADSARHKSGCADPVHSRTHSQNLLASL